MHCVFEVKLYLSQYNPDCDIRRGVFTMLASKGNHIERVKKWFGGDHMTSSGPLFMNISTVWDWGPVRLSRPKHNHLCPVRSTRDLPERIPIQSTLRYTSSVETWTYTPSGHSCQNKRSTSPFLYFRMCFLIDYIFKWGYMQTHFFCRNNFNEQLIILFIKFKM